jgi:BASS family bile acid:Na+ symporter
MKLIKFLKDWTLPVSMGMGTIVYLIFAFVPALESAAEVMEPVFNTILPLFMFLILFVTF